MAIAVIGGLVTSTFLSLMMIPVVYTYVDDFVAWTRKRRGLGPEYAVEALQKNPANAA